MKKVSIVTLGCAKNQNDTENLSGLLKKKGYVLENNPSRADAIIVHTCSFIEAAKKESVQTILEAAGTKKKNSKLIVTGCMVQQHGKEMMEELPEVDAFLGTGQLPQVVTYLAHPRERFLDRRNPGGLLDPDAPRILEKKGATATLRLSEGCRHPCSFCVIPKLRGGLQSRPEAIILREAYSLARQGIQEILLIGQDTGDWGHDFSRGRPLPELLRKLRDIHQLRWIRLMYMHPASLTNEMINVLHETPDQFPYLDIPFQHIDNKILNHMKRYLTESQHRHLIDNIRNKLPLISLRTTLIVGYPGESEKQFTKLLKFVEEGHFDYLGAFAYSREENTPASLNPHPIPEKVKQERLKLIQEAQYSVAERKAKNRIGSIETIVIDEIDGKTAWGRTNREAPEIDAVVRLPKGLVRKKPFIRAKLTSFDAYEFKARGLISGDANSCRSRDQAPGLKKQL